MKVLKRGKDGYARLKIENEDDLWYLKDIISGGDRVKALTQRTTIEGREKKTLKLTLEVEKIDYQGSRLRVTGEMVKGDEEVEHGYHTFNLEEDDELEIWKDWTEHEEERLEEAESSRSYEVLFCIMDKGEANLYLVKESGIEDLSQIKQNIPGKFYADQESGEGFLQDLKSAITRAADEVDSLVIGGPGFEKQKLYNLLPEEIQQKSLMQDTSVTGETGLQEAIKRGALKRVVESSRIDEETSALEQFFGKLEADENADYGEPVKELAEQGAVEKLLVTDEKFREERSLVKNVEQQGGEVQVVHTDHEPGERLANLGGIAAELRYRP